MKMLLMERRRGFWEFLEFEKKKLCVAGEYRLMSQPRGNDSVDDSPHNKITFDTAKKEKLRDTDDKG